MYKRKESEKVKFLDLMIVTILSFMLALPKGGCYLPLVFLILFVPKEKIQWKYPAWVYKILPLIFSIGGFFVYYDEIEEKLVKKANI